MTKYDKPGHAWGIASLILGILSLFLFLAPYIGIFLAVAAVVFYAIQRKHEPTGMATGGLVTGIIGIILNGIMLLFIVGMLALFGAISEPPDLAVQPTERVVEERSQTETPTQKIKSATVNIDRVVETVANLDNIRLTIVNTGDVSIRPKFDVVVTDSSGKTVCEGSPMWGIGSISAGETKTDEIRIFCTFEKDGDYKVKVDLLDENYKKLDSGEKTLTVKYWGKFEF